MSMPTVATRPYRTRRRSTRSERTRARIVETVGELLAEGAFHSSTMEEVADRAGVSRATLYQHFRSRVDLVDAICERFAVNPALVKLRTLVELADPEAALTGTLAQAIRFWASEDAVLSQLYGVAAIDPAAAELVERQREDRRGEMQRLAHHLQRAGRLPEGTSEGRALAQLMVLTAYDTFRELRAAGLSQRELTRTVQESGRSLLLRTPAR